jgi:sulfur carrier protein ThiS
MIIEAKIFSSLRHYLPTSERLLDGEKWDIKEGSTVAQVLIMLNLPGNEIKTILINGRKANMETVLKEGDVLAVFPIIMGG